MKIKQHHILSLLLTLLFMANTAHARVVKLVTFNYPPLFHTSVEGEFSGTVGETVKYACEQTGLQCDIEVLPFKRAYQKIDNKLADGIITIKVPRFEDCCTPTQWETPWSAGFFTHMKLNETPQISNDVLGQSLIVVAGMRSPYAFMPQLDTWHKEKAVQLFTANDVYTATRMFLSKRAPLLWGSDDFNWYFKKQNINKEPNFLPLIVRPIVIWFQKEQTDLQKTFNQAFAQIKANGKLDHKQLLHGELMEKRYKDAPFQEK
ncbi:transporter substrate-binding domain-containing protein [Terasakiella sp. SH-1]|uniref:substrate-binding periplasmic protein n=1 Tax=Terasakiella sp. SH-1 TaxID=2560057 RepID=UPI00107348B1|nr:transporter substrate-binding domain-containing protein [Terasakiella sp. SH-1]